MEEFLSDNAEDLKLLARAVRNEGFRFIIIEHKHPKAYYLLRAWFADTQPERKVREVRFEGSNFVEISAQLKEAEGEVVFLPDTDVLFFEENADLAVAFNQRRDHYAKRNITFVSMVEPAGVKRVPEVLPDLWSMRSVEMELGVESIPLNLIHLPIHSLDRIIFTREELNAFEKHLLAIEGNKTTPNSQVFLDQMIPLIEMGLRLDFKHQSTTFSGVIDNLLALGTKKKVDTTIVFLLTITGRGLSQNSDFEKALVCFEKATEAAKIQGIKNLEAFALTSTALTYVKMGNLSKAQKLINESLKTSKDAKDQQNQALAYLTEVEIIKETIGLDAAILKLDVAFDLFVDLGNTSMARATLGSKALLLADRGDYISSTYLINYIKRKTESSENDTGQIALSIQASLFWLQFWRSTKYEKAVKEIVVTISDTIEYRELKDFLENTLPNLQHPILSSEKLSEPASWLKLVESNQTNITSTLEHFTSFLPKTI